MYLGMTDSWFLMVSSSSLQSLGASIEKARSPQMAEADLGTVRRHLELDLTLWTGLLCS